MKDLTQQSTPENTFSALSRIFLFFLKHKNHFILLLLFFFYGFILIPLGDYKHPEVSHAGYYSIQRFDQGDDAGYYAYLRSGVIDGNFDFFNEKRYWHFDGITPTGYSTNLWFLGQSIIWLPFFLIGHAIAWVYSLLNYPVATTGYSFPYHALTFIGSSCEVFIGLIICNESLKKYFSDKACLLTTILIFSSTSLPYFTFIRNRMSHPGDFLIASIFFLFLLSFRENQNRPPIFFVLWGIFAGVLFDLRFSNLLYLIFPLGLMIESFTSSNAKTAKTIKRQVAATKWSYRSSELTENSSQKNKFLQCNSIKRQVAATKRSYRSGELTEKTCSALHKALYKQELTASKKNRLLQSNSIYPILLGSIALVITTLPQWFSWWALNGAPLPATGGMAILVTATLSSILSSLGNLFFSSNWGLIFTEPIWFIGVVGLVMFLRKDKTLGILSLLFFSVSCVIPVVLGNGASFGQRYLIPALPVMAMGLAYFLEIALKKRFQALILSSVIILSGWLYVLLLNYKIFLNYNAADFALRAFQNIPLILHDMTLFRPTTYADLLLNGNLNMANYVDYFFLIIFPFLQAVLPILLLILANKTFTAIRHNNGFENSTANKFSAVFLFFMVILTCGILIRHPELPQQTKKERLQIAAASIFLKEFPSIKGFLSIAIKAMAIEPEDEITQLILADANFIHGYFAKAKFHYLKVIDINKNSPANFQLDRIKVLTGRKKLSLSRLTQELNKGDPDGDINRWLGIYYLDIVKQPDKSIHFFKKSLNINPTQKHANALKNLIHQYFQQKKRLVSRRISSNSLPQTYHAFLNTYINFVRLNVILIDQQL